MTTNQRVRGRAEFEGGVSRRAHTAWNWLAGAGIALAFTAGGCLAEEGDYGSATYEVDVTWSGAVGVSTSGNDLTKTAPNAWGNGGAASTETVASGDTFAEFTTAETTSYKMAGLSSGDTNQGFADIDFAFYMRGDGSLQIYEQGFRRATVGTYSAGDTLRVEVVGGQVRYLRNGSPVYTSTRTPSYPMGVDTALFTLGATINDVRLASSFWENDVGVSVVGTDLTKTAATGWGNSGAATSGSLANDGYVEFTSNEATTYKMAGLSNGDVNQGFADIDYAFYLRGNGTLQVYEGGFLVQNVGTYTAGDVFRIEATSSSVVYSVNGTPVRTTLTSPTFPLLVDTALYTNGATLTNFVLAESFWATAVGVSVSGNTVTKTTPSGWNTSGSTTSATIAGDGFAEFSTGETNTYKMAGLSNGNTDQNFDDIDFAFYMRGDGTLQVYEGGLLRTTVGAYSAGDTLRIESVGGTVTYLQNGTPVYTSAGTPTAPLLLDTALFSRNATINSVVLGDITP